MTDDEIDEKEKLALKYNNQSRIKFISSQIRENRIAYEILKRELAKEIKEFEELDKEVSG
tara:strand:- start:78 stop:257 length:180 start_codon:yes stop_codon:yes gene_type:complete